MIDEDALRQAFADLRARVVYLEQRLGLFVDESLLDRPRGNPKIHFDPRQWRGPSCKGRRASECPPAFLDAYAEALSYLAAHPKDGADPRSAANNRRDAARVRTWARRLRRNGAGRPADAAPPPANETNEHADDEYL